jgi:Ca2+-binding RTX toxin-like protein
MLAGNRGDDTLFGGAGNDALFGGKEDDLLFGGDGADRLSGDLGDDTLTGGSGADRFLFGPNAGTDTVTDFSLADGDRLVLPTGAATILRSDASGNAVLSLSTGGSITLAGIAPGSFTTDWFGTA